ncbi:hypothetical protein [Brevibacterium spongiae]|uniref:4'-phosphopantetheinyl transferase superfamily protein n=1 Tax=Brevibacterium spongiae TaxID=2909672 RepID=A0ABY5SUV7_9MICO|nr:hypothetical protein [Brevibacterium spongiae]UVI36849.1 hypothetical protein L1F31_04095 [Brevibacterium spongiae]
MRSSTSRDLERFRWTHPRLPRHTSIAVCPAEAVDRLGLARLSPTDRAGATGLLLALLSEEFAAPADRINLHRPRPEAHFRYGHRPATATAGPGTPILLTSLARAPGCIAAAVSRGRIGIDIEQTQTDEQGRDLLTLVHPADRAAARFAEAGPGWVATMIWTRIEAGVKLRGTGLRRDPASLRVGVGPAPLPLARVQTLTIGCDRRGRTASSVTENSVSDRSVSEYSVSDFAVSVAWESRLLRS